MEKKQKLQYVNLNLVKVNEQLEGLTGQITWEALKYRINQNFTKLTVKHGGKEFHFKILVHSKTKKFEITRESNFPIEKNWSNHIAVLINKAYKKKIPLSNY